MAWEKVKLGDVLHRKTDRINISPEEEYKLITIRLHHNGVVLRKKAIGKTIKSNMSLVKAGDFVLSGIDARNGAFGIVPAELDGAIITNDFWCLEPDETKMKKEFLLFLTSTKYFDYICNQSSDGTTQRIRLQKDKFYEYEIELPPLEEQEEVLTQLRQVTGLSEDVIDEQSNQLNLLKKLIQQILQDAVMGKLVEQKPDDEPASVLLGKIVEERQKLIAEGKIKKGKPQPEISEEDIPFEIPASWEWCKLGDLIAYAENLDIHKKLPENEMINYVDIDSIDNTDYVIKEIKRKRVSELSSRARRILKKDYIVYSTVRPYLRNIAIVQNEMPNFIGSTGFNVFRAIIVSKEYLFNFLISPEINNTFKQMMVGFNSPSITNELFNNTLVPLPPLNEQHRIVAKVEQLMKTCDDLEQSIQQNQKYTQDLLQVALKEALEPK